MITKEALQFLEDLIANNNTDWMHANKKRYENYKKDYHNFLYKWFDEEEFQHNRRPREGHLIPSWLVIVDGQEISLR